VLRRRLRLPSLSGALTADLAGEWADCVNCALSASRSQVVAGEGPMPAELMLVADAPGFHDDRLGRPLVAAAGELLADLLASIGLERRDVYVTTLVKCRPPGTQSPASEEIEACRDKLERQVELVRPRILAALGDLATRALAGGTHGVSQTHGQVRRAAIGGREITLLPLYHPAAALHNARLLPALEADMERLGELLGRTAVARAPAEPEPEPPAQPAADEQQLGLF
jgi:uracil-DNA glycosylase family 4